MTSKLDDDVKISVVLREAPTKLRDNLLVNSQQFESNDNKLRATIQAYLNSNKIWTANDFRNDARESDPMEVDHSSKGKSNGKGKGKGKDTDTDTDKDKDRDSKGKGTKPGKQDKECYVCERALRARLLVTSKPRQNS